MCGGVGGAKAVAPSPYPIPHLDTLLVPHQVSFRSEAARIFVVRWGGKTAGRLEAFQGFDAPHGGKKTDEALWKLA